MSSHPTLAAKLLIAVIASAHSKRNPWRISQLLTIGHSLHGELGHESKNCHSLYISADSSRTFTACALSCRGFGNVLTSQICIHHPSYSMLVRRLQSLCNRHMQAVPCRLKCIPLHAWQQANNLVTILSFVLRLYRMGNCQASLINPSR